MSKYKDHNDSTLSICPYCDNSFYVEGEDYNVDSSQVEECEECGKKYRRTTSVTVTHETSPNCELNGESHDYKRFGPDGFYVCQICGDVSRTGDITS